MQWQVEPDLFIGLRPQNVDHDRLCQSFDIGQRQQSGHTNALLGIGVFDPGGADLESLGYVEIELGRR